MITIIIKTENAAFGETEESRNQEAGRILRELGDKLSNGVLPESLRDINGNKVGSIKVR